MDIHIDLIQLVDFLTKGSDTMTLFLLIILHGFVYECGGLYEENQF